MPQRTSFGVCLKEEVSKFGYGERRGKETHDGDVKRNSSKKKSLKGKREKKRNSIRVSIGGRHHLSKSLEN